MKLVSQTDQILLMSVYFLCLLTLYPLHEIRATESTPGETCVLAPIIPPTHYSLHYGPDAKQVLSFWRAEGSSLAPLVFFVHGGGWYGGGWYGGGINHFMKDFLMAGISVVSIDYRFIPDAKKSGYKYPVLGSLWDIRRALQFVRSKANYLNIDKNRIAGMGDSAGGFSILWLALHRDMAVPTSTDPVASESTRFIAASVFGAQTTLDPKLMRAWIPNIDYGYGAFGFSSFENFLKERTSVLSIINDISPFNNASAEAPPIRLWYHDTPDFCSPSEPDCELPRNPTHSANFGAKLAERLNGFGVSCEYYYKGVSQPHSSTFEFLLDKLN